MKKCKCGKEHDGSFGSGKFCSRSCANSRVWSEKDKIKKSESAKRSEFVKIANKRKRDNRFVRNRYGLKQEKIIWTCPYCGKQLKIRITQKKSYCNNNTPCQKQYHSEFQKSQILSGKRVNNWGGRCKKIEYNGIKLDGSFELEFVKWCERNEIWFERNKDKFEYFYNGKLKHYFPDFKLEDNIYVECKGYETEKDRAKWSYFPYKLIVLRKNDIKNLKLDKLSILDLLD